MRELLTQAMQDGRSGRGSSKRVNAVIATIAMSLAVVILAVGACLGKDVSVALIGVSTTLAGLAGANYIGGKHIEGKRKEE